MVRRLGHTPVGMEADGADERPPLEVCLEDVRGCQAYIGIIGFRYGTCPPGETRSYTELEYEEAGRVEIPQRLIFIANPDATDYQPGFVDTHDRRMRDFRERVSAAHSVARFSSPDALAAEVEKALRSCFRFHRVVPELLPYLCDRRDQERALEKSLSTRIAHRPVVLVVHGDRAEAHRRFIDRLSQVTLPRLLSLQAREKVVEYRLAWPETRDEHSRLEDWLARELGRAVLDRPPGSPSTVQDAFARMARMHGPVVISVLADRETWVTNEASTLASFARFWDACPDFPAHHPLIVCLAVTYALDRRQAWWRLWGRWSGHGVAAALERAILPSMPRLTLVRPPRLGHESVSRQHVDNWMQVEVRPLSESLSLDEDVLEEHIERIFARHREHGRTLVPMEPLAVSLKDALESSAGHRNRRLFA